jgi:hypothetical protein
MLDAHEPVQAFALNFGDQGGIEGSAFGEDRAVVTLVACSDGAGWGWLCASRRAR